MLVIIDGYGFVITRCEVVVFVVAGGVVINGGTEFVEVALLIILSIRGGTITLAISKLQVVLVKCTTNVVCALFS